MRKAITLQSITRTMLACSMSVILVLGLMPSLAFATSSKNLPLNLATQAPEGITSWSALQAQIRSAEDGSTIQLTQTLVAKAEDSCLEIPSGKKLTIDLAGNTLNRGLGGDDVTAKDDGAVIQVSRDAELTLVNTSEGDASIRGGNNSYDGGGIINQGVLAIGGKGSGGLIRITFNKAYFGAGIFNTGTATIDGATVYNNDASSSGGGIFNQGGNLTITDVTIDHCNAKASGGGIYNSGGTVTIDGATISNCFADENGGAISNAGTLAIEYADIRLNHAYELGGGVYVGRRGKATIEDGLIVRNSAGNDGGGAYVETTGTLTLGYAPSINTNKAGEGYHGGGVYVRGSLVVTGGRPVVSGNTHGNSAPDNIYLPGTKRIEVAGHLSGGKLAVTLEGDTGKVTQGFGAQGNTAAAFFKGDNRFAAVKDGEVWLQVDAPQPEFMRPQQLAKPSQVNGTNWMAAIPGEWYITEFNVPYSHDSATKRISKWHVIGNFICQGQLKKQGADYATTQLLSIPDQLNAGVRCLDVRMNNLYAYDGGDFDCKWRDDGENLWVCHGRSMSTGTYFALNPDATMISVSQVLNEAKQFLTDHPTETISILFTVESHQYDKVHDLIFLRLKTYLEKLAGEINPSTGEPYLYCEEGRGFFDHYTHIPKLEDARGKIVVQYDAKEEDIERGKTGGRIIGGMLGLRDVDDVWPEGVRWMREQGGNGVKADKKIENINAFIYSVNTWHDGWPQIARDAATHRNYFFFMSPSTHTEDGWSYFTNTNHPLDIAEDVNYEFFDKDGAFFNQRGKYVGWVKMDGILEKYAEMIWKSNFANDDFLDYCKVTVKSGQDASAFPDQVFKEVLKGSSITMPECIYDYNPQECGEFVGWELQKLGSSAAEVLHPGDTYVVTSDTVITAKWGDVDYDQIEVHLNRGADDASLDPNQEPSFLASVGNKINLTMMNKATRLGYKLDGWYTADGVKITESTRLRQSMCDKDDNGAVVMTERAGRMYQQITLTARWISTKDPAIIASEPTARILTNNGNPQELVTAGIATGGTFMYALGDDGQSAPSAGSFKAEIPKGTDVGAYYVWYKVVGDASHSDVEPGCVVVTITEHAHTPGSAQHENEVGATCTEKGSYDAVVRCTVCGKVLSSTPVAVPALGHDWDAWRIIEEATEDHDGLQIRTCKRCSEDQIEAIVAPEHVHRPIFVSAVEPHCVSSGTKAHYECICGKWFADSEGITEISPASCSIRATGHTALDKIVPERTNEVPATCTEPGSHRDVYRCDKCAQVLNVVHVIDAPKGHTWIVDETTNADGWRASMTSSTVYEDRECSACGFTETRSYKLGHLHDTQIFPGVQATCDQPGVKEHDVCHICGHSLLYNFDTKVFDDIPEAELVIPALGHDWGKPEYTWSSDGDTVTATCTCGRDSEHVAFETASVSAIATKEATCTEAGELAYTATFVSEAFTPQVRTETIPAHGHDWNEWVLTKEPACEQAGTETRTCKNDPAHVETHEIAALGHDWSEWTVTKEPTDMAEGEEVRSCSRCDKVEIRSIPKKDEVSYRAVSGDGATWTKGSSESLVFTFKRNVDDNETFDHFTGIQVDGADVDKLNYTAKSGSAVVTLLPSYLETLAVGEHTLAAQFDDAAAVSATFKVVKRDDSESKKSGAVKATPARPTSTMAKAGDDLKEVLPIVFTLLVASAVVIVALAVKRRKI